MNFKDDYHNEMAHIMANTTLQLVKLADKYDLDRDTVIKHYNLVLLCASNVATWKHMEVK